MAVLVLLALVQVGMCWTASGETICYYRQHLDERSVTFSKGLCNYDDELENMISVKTESTTEPATHSENRKQTRLTVLTLLLSSIKPMQPSISVSFTFEKDTDFESYTTHRSTLPTNDVTTLKTLRETKRAITRKTAHTASRNTASSSVMTPILSSVTSMQSSISGLFSSEKDTVNGSYRIDQSPSPTNDVTILATMRKTMTAKKEKMTSESLTPSMQETITTKRGSRVQESTFSTDGKDASVTTRDVASTSSSLETEVCNTWTVHGSSCYLFVMTDAPTWYDAAAQCESYHPQAHLVFIESASENEFVATLIGNGPTPWIGLSDEDVEDQWVWSHQGASTDTLANYVNWDSDYYNSDRRNCGYIRGRSKRWQSYPCDTPEVFICELEQ